MRRFWTETASASTGGIASVGHHTDRTLLRISLPPLAPGKYRVTWRVLSVDTHVATGEFTFDVAP
jgi:methionine-rich copper-binding protein CopC